MQSAYPLMTIQVPILQLPKLHSVLTLTVILLLVRYKGLPLSGKTKVAAAGPSCCSADKHHSAMNQGHGMDQCMFLIECPTRMCWAKNEKYKNKRQNKGDGMTGNVQHTSEEHCSGFPRAEREL